MEEVKSVFSVFMFDTNQALMRLGHYDNEYLTEGLAMDWINIHGDRQVDYIILQVFRKP